MTSLLQAYHPLCLHSKKRRIRLVIHLNSDWYVLFVGEDKTSFPTAHLGFWQVLRFRRIFHQPNLSSSTMPSINFSFLLDSFPSVFRFLLLLLHKISLLITPTDFFPLFATSTSLINALTKLFPNHFQSAKNFRYT